MPEVSPSAQVPAQISHIIAAQDHWYVNFITGAEPGHNNHLVLAWAVMDDLLTVLPLVTSPSNQRDVVRADSVSSDYVILNPYSQCEACVRPPEPVEAG